MVVIIYQFILLLIKQKWNVQKALMQQFGKMLKYNVLWYQVYRAL